MLMLIVNETMKSAIMKLQFQPVLLVLILILTTVISEDACETETVEHCQPETISRSRRLSEKDSILVAKNVLDSGIALLLIKNKASLNVFLNLFKVSSPALALVASLISAFIPSGPSELDIVLERLEKIDNNFELVRNDIKTLSDNIEYGQKINLLFDPMVNIDLGMTYVIKFLKEQESNNVSIETNPWRRPLVEEVCPKIAKDLKTILNVGAGTEILDSIFRTLFDKSRGNRQKLVDLGSVLSLSVRKGILVFVKCETFQNNSRSVEQLLGLFSRDVEHLDCAIQTFITKAEQEVCSNIDQDANSIILELAGLSVPNYQRNIEVVIELKKELASKYDWLTFVVVVYNKDIKEFSDLAFGLPKCDRASGLIAKLDVGQMNTLIYYTDRCLKMPCNGKREVAYSVVSNTIDNGEGAQRIYEKLLAGLNAQGFKEPSVYVIKDSGSDCFEGSNDDSFFTPIRSVLPAELEAYDVDYGDIGVSKNYHVGVIAC
jgi:hypothetical protein